MKIYFAGVAGVIEREKRWFKVGLKNRLISYYSHITNNQLNRDTQVIFNLIKENKLNDKKKSS
jgi:hypothetical protein